MKYGNDSRRVEPEERELAYSEVVLKVLKGSSLITLELLQGSELCHQANVLTLCREPSKDKLGGCIARFQGNGLWGCLPKCPNKLGGLLVSLKGSSLRGRAPLPTRSVLMPQPKTG
jgi:hypothetical protein